MSRSANFSKDEIITIISYLENTPHLVSGEFSKTCPSSTEMMRDWDALARITNSSGLGIERTGLQIKNKWLDLKYRTKKKASLLKNELNQTGGGPRKNEKLTDLEERILGLIGQTCIIGIQSILFDSTARIIPIISEQHAAQPKNVCAMGSEGLRLLGSQAEQNPAASLFNSVTPNSTTIYTSPASSNMTFSHPNSGLGFSGTNDEVVQHSEVDNNLTQVHKSIQYSEESSTTTNKENNSCAMNCETPQSWRMKKKKSIISTEYVDELRKKKRHSIIENDEADNEIVKNQEVICKNTEVICKNTELSIVKQDIIIELQQKANVYLERILQNQETTNAYLESMAVNMSIMAQICKAVAGAEEESATDATIVEEQ